MKIIKNIFVVVLFCTLFAGSANAQLEKGKVMILGASDIFRSNNTDPSNWFKRVGIGIGARYFISRKFAAGLGYEYSFTSFSNANSWNAGIRFYPAGNLFARAKANFFNKIANTRLIQFELGAGYDFMLSDRWMLETNLDYYINNINDSFFGIKIGFCIII